MDNIIMLASWGMFLASVKLKKEARVRAFPGNLQLYYGGSLYKHELVTAENYYNLQSQHNQMSHMLQKMRL